MQILTRVDLETIRLIYIIDVHLLLWSLGRDPFRFALSQSSKVQTNKYACKIYSFQKAQAQASINQSVSMIEKRTTNSIE